MDLSEIPTSTIEQIAMMEGILIAAATGGSPDNHIFEHLRREFMADPTIRDLLPQFVRTYRNLNAFWPFIKHEAGTYAERRQIISGAFTPLMDHLEGRNAAPGDKVASDALETFDVDDPVDHEDLCALLERYDEVISTGPSKIGSGIHHFETRENNSHGGITVGFWVIRTDGSDTDFSFIVAVDGHPRNPDADFVEACREAVYEGITAAKREFFQRNADESGRVICAVTGDRISEAAAKPDYTGKTLRDIAWAFRDSEGWVLALPSGIVSPPADAQVAVQFVDMDAMIRFRAFHDRVAKMRIVSRSLLPSRLSATRHLEATTPLSLGLSIL